MGSSVHAVCLGLYARKRHRFRNDFTYNKFHFGVFLQIFSAIGIAAAGKLRKPLVPCVCFLAATCLVSLPAYSEGLKEIRNEPDMRIDSSGMMRRAGIYFFIGGWVLLFCKRRGSIPFMPPKMNKLL